MRIRDRGIYTRTNPYWEFGISATQFVDLRRGRLAIQLQVFNLTNNRAPAFPNGFDLNRNNRKTFLTRQQPLSILAGVQYVY